MAHLYNHTKTQQKLQQARKSQLSRLQAQGDNYNLTQAADAGRTHTHTHTESDLTGVKRLSLVRRLLSKVNLLSIVSNILYWGIPDSFIALMWINVKKGNFLLQPLEQSELRLVATLSDPHPLEGRRRALKCCANCGREQIANSSGTKYVFSSTFQMWQCNRGIWLHFVQRSVKSHFIKHRLSACESFDIIQLSGDLGGSS